MEPNTTPMIPISPGTIYYSRVYAGVISTLVLLSLPVVAARLYTRHKSAARLRADDYIIAVAFAFATANWIVMLTATRPTIDDVRSVPLSDVVATAPLAVASELLSSWALALVKTSIAAMLLRFLQTSNGWKTFLYSIVAVQITTAIFLTIMHLTRCIPLNALWNPMVTEKRCWDDQAFRVSLTVTAVIVIVTDVIYSLMPLAFLRNLRRPVRDRIVIGVLLSLGLVATGASIAKTVAVQSFGKQGKDDPVGDGLAIALWASVEEHLALIAACIPCLKAPFGRVLLRFGFLTTNTNSNTERRYGGVTTMGARTGTSRQKHTYAVATSHHGGTASVEEILGPALDVERKYGEVLRTTEVRIEIEMSAKPNSSVG
ncbi:hypothetical protein B0T16DRAFT_319129 [Cercophora newfieldiana]|uniref:Rhodopsin domain-containing protein n=1 Tax=Cercophora newfieldiana TaxID=92897 RepID=A0AA39YPC2_9PEZI|nr:hypothetical protein B0T16DRAFT_319129 [Cercophora newfieldiana]